MQDLTLRYRLLVVLFIVAGYSTTGTAVHAIRVLWNGSQAQVDSNFPIRLATREFGWGGKFFRWQVQTIDGVPFTRGNQIRETTMHHQPGDPIRLELKGPQGEVQMMKIPVHPAIRPHRSLNDIILVSAISLFLPVFCFVLGFVVVGIRPHDPLAWLLLALLLSFSETTHEFEWDLPLRAAAMLWHHAVRELWPVWMMLFGLFFPRRSVIDRRLPWLKWLMIALVVATSGLMTAIGGARAARQACGQHERGRGEPAATHLMRHGCASRPGPKPS